MATLINTMGIWNKKGLVVDYFLRHPTKEVHIRLLARTLGLSAPWVSKAVRDIERQGILSVNKDKERQEILVKAQRDAPSFRVLKQWNNLRAIASSGLVDYLVQSYGKPECIVLFGSYAKGEDIESSDIDIALITKRRQNLLLSTFEKKLERKISVKELSKESIEKEFWKTLANGIVLYGYLEVPV